MAKIRINFSGVEDANRSLEKTLSKLQRAEKRLTELRRQVDMDIQARYKIGQTLKRAEEETAAVRKAGARLKTVAEQGLQQYGTTERWLNSHTPDNGKV